MSNPQHLVQKLWNYFNTLRDDDLSYRVKEELEAVAGANVRCLTRLRQSMLQEAFSGQLIPNKHQKSNA